MPVLFFVLRPSAPGGGGDDTSNHSSSSGISSFSQCEEVKTGTTILLSVHVTLPFLYISYTFVMEFPQPSTFPSVKHRWKHCDTRYFYTCPCRYRINSGWQTLVLLSFFLHSYIFQCVSDDGNTPTVETPS